MTPYEIQRAIDVFLSSWTTTPIRYVSMPAPALPYIEHHLLLGDVIGLEIQGVAERVGVLAIDIFTVMTAGDLAGFSYGGSLEEMFWHKKTGRLFFENADQMPATTKAGIDEARRAFHFQTTIPLSIIMEY